MSTTEIDARNLIDRSANQLQAVQFALSHLDESSPSEEAALGLSDIIDSIVDMLKRADSLIVDHLVAAEQRIEERFEAERKKRRGDDVASALEEMRSEIEARVEKARKEGYADALRLNAGSRPTRSRRRPPSAKAP